VLGPVPGIFGSLQALLTLKILLGLEGQLAGEILLLDFMNFSNLLLKAPRRGSCTAPNCTLIREIAREETDLEITLPSLAAAAHGSSRSSTSAPPPKWPRTRGRPHIAMPALLAIQANCRLTAGTSSSAHPASAASQPPVNCGNAVSGCTRSPAAFKD